MLMLVRQDMPSTQPWRLRSSGTRPIPARNEADLDDVPAGVLAELEVHPLSDVRDVLALALEPAYEQVLAA